MIVFARHGQTDVNASGRLQGRLDPPLTELGRDQARRIAQALRADALARVVTSPLRRARETAEIITEGLGIDAPVVDERLVELDYGAWDGRAVRDVTGQEWARWRADPDFAPPGGESLATLRARTVALCEELLTVDEAVCCVSHVSPIKAAVTWALGVGDAATWRMHLGVASVCRIERRGTDPVLVSFNGTEHLESR